MPPRKPATSTRAVVPQYAQPSLDLPASFTEAVDAWGGEFEELPTDWRLMEKESLIGVPFLCYRFEFRESDKGRNREYVSVYIVTEDDRRLVINDGGTGIYEQAKEWTDRTHKTGGLLCRNGLRVSKYDHPEFGESETFYLT